MRTLLSALASLLCLGVAAPAVAQGITTEAVADAYVEAVSLCTRAVVADGGIASLSADDRARVADAGAEGRSFANVPEGRPAWDVLSARGAIIVSEPEDGTCNVLAYGPRVRPVFDSTAQTLTAPAAGFTEIEVTPDPSAILRTFEKADGDRIVTVRLDGGEPGMPGRTFRFPMLLAFVSVGAR